MFKLEIPIRLWFKENLISVAKINWVLLDALEDSHLTDWLSSVHLVLSADLSHCKLDLVKLSKLHRASVWCLPYWRRPLEAWGKYREYKNQCNKTRRHLKKLTWHKVSESVFSISTARKKYKTTLFNHRNTIYNEWRNYNDKDNNKLLLWYILVPDLFALV